MDNTNDTALASKASLWSKIRKGSVSFALASRFLPRKARLSVLRLYSFCRYADDTVDQVEAAQSKDWSINSWQSLHDEVATAMNGDSIGANPIIAGVRSIQVQHNFPKFYVFDLLAGMRADSVHRQPADEAELENYCYQVAGTVGGMFCYIVGVRDEAALKHALDLGRAMQLTNISRDVMEDFNNGRIYLPANLCREVGIDASNFSVQSNRGKLFAIVNKLLLRADSLYRSGDEGLNYLSLRTAFAVAVARCVYSEIGVKVRKRGAAAWDERVYVTATEKFFLLFRAFGLVAKTIPTRFRRLKSGTTNTLRSIRSKV
jgi:phytoene synthase